MVDDLFKCRGQSANPENDRGLVVIVARFRVSRRREGDNTDLARRKSFRRPARALGRFAGDRLVAFKAFSLAGGERLHEVDRFPCHQIFRNGDEVIQPGSCRALTAPLRSLCALSGAIAIYFAGLNDRSHVIQAGRQESAQR